MLTPAVVVYFIGTYMTVIVGTPVSVQPLWWLVGYIIFVGLNARGVALSFRVTVTVTLIAIAILVFFLLSALFSGQFDIARWAMNVGADANGQAVELKNGGGTLLPLGVKGIFAGMPFAVWLFLAIEQLPLAAEELVDPKRDMPRGIMLGMFTLIGLGFLVMLIIWFVEPSETAVNTIGGTVLNMAVFGAMFSYMMQGLTFLQLRRRFPNIERPYRSPFGTLGASLTVIIAVVTIIFQLTDPLYREGAIGVAIWYAIAIVYFAVHGRKQLIYSPEEEFAVKQREGASSM